MRGRSVIAAFLLLVALPLFAQRGGGGHSGGGGHAGGGFSGHSGFSGGHSFGGGFHSGSSFAPHSYSRGFSRGPIASRGFNRNFNRGFNRNRGTNFRLRTYGFRNNCYGYNCGYGYGWGSPYLWGGIDPYWWWDNDSNSDNGYDAAAPYNYDDGLANQMYQQGVPMRPPDPREQNSSTRAQHQPERTEIATPTVLVFRDQHKQEVNNYAIVGEILWAFAPQKTQKIPLDDLDIPATQKANEERGVDFSIPGAQAGKQTLVPNSFTPAHSSPSST